MQQRLSLEGVGGISKEVPAPSFILCIKKQFVLLTKPLPPPFGGRAVGTPCPDLAVHKT